MTDSAFSGSDDVKVVLEEIAKRMGNGYVVVGFMEGGTYTDGTLVAAVAYKNEFGVPLQRQPPRPFFRQMIAKESPTWAKKMENLAKGTNYDGSRVLALMGEDIGGALIQSINDLTTPKLAAYTIAKKGFDKPLIDTSHMINSICYRVNDDGAIVKVEA